MQLCQLPMLLLAVGWTTVTHFSGVSKVNLHRLQSIQNSAARIVKNSCKYTWITPVLGETPLAPYSVSLRVQTGYPGVHVYSYWFP